MQPGAKDLLKDIQKIMKEFKKVLPTGKEADDLAKDLANIEIKDVKKLLDLDKKITGFNVGVNAGSDAGQSIMHCHIHLIPRRKGDIENPRGGVRGVIPSKQKYNK